MELVALRGANWHFPEDSMAAFRRALQDGAQVLEMDVYMTKDEVMAVHHESVWHGKKIAKIRYEALAFEVPSFEEVLLAFPTIKFNVDIASRDLKAVYLTVDMIRKHGAASRVCLISESVEVQHWLSDLKYEGERSLSYFEILAVFLLPVPWLKAFHLSNRRAQVPVRLGPFYFDSLYFIRKCHSFGILVDYRVVNQLQVARKLAHLGADRITTDDPATLVSLSLA